MLDLADPDPDSSEVAALAKTYKIQVVNNQIYAKTRNYMSKEGTIISAKYRVILKESAIMPMIIQDAHLHGLGFMNHHQAVLKSGVISLNLKKLVKKCQSRCTRCRRICLLPSSNKESPDNTLVFSNLPPFSCIQLDVAGEFRLADIGLPWR